MMNSEARKKMSESRKKFLRNGGKHPWLGRHHSEDTKEKLRQKALKQFQNPKNRKLAGVANIGKKASIELKKKLSDSHKGKRPYAMTDEIRMNISKGKRGRTVLGNQKEKHWNWKGGITPLLKKIRHSFKYRQWRSDVFTRDDFICQECNKRGGRIEGHHIKEFKAILLENNITTLEDAYNCEELWNINNGVTLCKLCHTNTSNFGWVVGIHKQYEE